MQGMVSLSAHLIISGFLFTVDVWQKGHKNILGGVGVGGAGNILHNTHLSKNRQITKHSLARNQQIYGQQWKSQ